MDAFDAHTYKDQKGDFNDADEARLIELLNQSSPKRILDIGCGDGKLTRRVQQSFPESKIVAIDNSPEQVTFATVEPSPISFQCASITEYESGEPFDTIFSFYAFPHMPKSLLPAALASTRKLLTANGIFYLFTNICLFDTSIATQVDQEACDITFLDGWHGQINLTSLEEMKKLCADAGFAIESDKRLETGARMKEYGEMVSWLFVLR